MNRRIFCYGDSNTYGFDPRPYLGGRLPAACRWTSLLQAETGWEVFSLGENGREIPHTTADYQALDALLTHMGSPDCFVIMLGTNDLFQLYQPTAEQIAGRMERLLQWLLQQFSACQTAVVLVSPPTVRLPGCEPLMQIMRALGHSYQALAEKYGVAFANAAAWDLPLACDGVHLSTEGHAVFARRISDFLHTLFADPFINQ